MRPCHPVGARWREWLAGSYALARLVLLQDGLLCVWMKRRCCACSSQLDRIRCNARPLSCTTPAGKGADAVRYSAVRTVKSSMLPTESQSAGRSASHALCRQPIHHHCRKMIEGLWGWTAAVLCCVVVGVARPIVSDCEREGEGGACLPPSTCHLFRRPSPSTVSTCA